MDGGIFIAHRLEIRTGNFNLQKHCLAAFSPLFPVAGKVNYMKSVAHYLTILAQYPKLEESIHVGEIQSRKFETFEKMQPIFEIEISLTKSNSKSKFEIKNRNQFEIRN